MKESNNALTSQVSELHREGEQRSKELSLLRNRTTLSQQNWLKEREELISREAAAREEFEAAKQAMQDWEVLAMEERSVRENLAERVSVLEEQLSAQTDSFERVASERDGLSLTVDGLQRALRDLQDGRLGCCKTFSLILLDDGKLKRLFLCWLARKQELRELVQNSERQVEGFRKRIQESERAASEAQSALEAARKELEEALPYQKEVKEKNLLIGKLRHEAVILNDHLTRALRYIRRAKPEDNVDRYGLSVHSLLNVAREKYSHMLLCAAFARQIVTNHLLHFLALDRADPKKFQVLQLIAALLNWTDGK